MRRIFQSGEPEETMKKDYSKIMVETDKKKIKELIAIDFLIKIRGEPLLKGRCRPVVTATSNLMTPMFVLKHQMFIASIEENWDCFDMIYNSKESLNIQRTMGLRYAGNRMKGYKYENHLLVATGRV